MPTVKNNLLTEQMVFILEKQDFVLEARKSIDGNDYTLEGIAAVFGKENNNHRIYEEMEYLPHLDYLQEKIAQNRLVGELDHPEKFDVSLKNISHIITALDYDKASRTLKIKVKLLDTPCGDIARKLVDAGVPLSISSRAAGSVGSDKKVQIKKIFTYDLVADPGFQNAQLERVYESAGFSKEEFTNYRTNSVTNGLECLNEDLGLKNESSVMIYKVENNEEFYNIINKNDNKNKKFLMENNEFVTAEELNKYSVFLKKEMDSMKSTISDLKEQKTAISESIEGESDLEERVAKLEKYSEYLAENLEGAIKYGEYLAENLDQSITYSKYLAENLDKNISYSKYLAENVDKSISYSEYVAESVDKNIDYTKYVAEKVDQSISYSEYLAENVEKSVSYAEYLAENLDKTISYSEYLAENLDKGIAYSEYLGEKLNDGIEYTEYIAENLNKGIEFSDYLAENINKGIDYSEYLAEKLNKSISYSEYIAESVSTKMPAKTVSLKESAEFSAKSNLKESGFAGNYDDLTTKIDSLIESVKTQKTEVKINEAASKLAPAETQKATQALNESEQTNKTGLKFIDEMPEEYTQIWESLNEGIKQSIVAQSNFYRLDTPYQIKNFWSTRQLNAKVVGLQKLQESEQVQTSATQSYANNYMENIANALEQRFQKR